MTKLVRCGINFYADVDNKKAVNDRDALQNTKLMEHYTHTFLVNYSMKELVSGAVLILCSE